MRLFDHFCGRNAVKQLPFHQFLLQSLVRYREKYPTAGVDLFGTFISTAAGLSSDLSLFDVKLVEAPTSHHAAKL